LLTRPAVPAPIIGPRTVEQLDGSLRAVELELEEKTLARLDEIFPGHRTAPEDYAW
jgi:aryl-alcohol dehydrogenase-like predicted oxidoreductase